MKILLMTLSLFLFAISAQTEEAPQVAPVAVKPELTLEQAYKREFLFLAAQKRELAERIDKLKKQSSAQLMRNEKEVEQLQKNYIKISRESEKAVANLAESEKSLAALNSEKELLDNVLAQSQSTLATLGNFTESEQDASTKSLDERIKTRLQAGLEALNTASALSVTDGQFYALDGKKVEGKLVNLGRIATFGLSADHSGSLAPAGEGKLKIWESISRDLSEKLLANNDLSELTVFLHESSNKEATKKEGKSLSDLMKAGGTIGWVIALLGVFTFIMVAIRSYLIFNAKKGSDTISLAVIELVKAGKKDEAIELTASKKSAVASLLQVILKAPVENKEAMENMASEQMIRQWSVIDRFGTLILVAASVAPLLGLLGTVTGMIATFDIITEFGTGDPKMLSSGISEALVTTMFGLVVAIPALMLGSILSTESEKIKSKMEEVALAIMNTLSLRS